MVPQLDLTAAGARVGRSRGTWLLGGLAAALGAALVLAAMGWAGLLLAACVAAGYGLTHLSGLELSLEERIAFGVVIGALAVSVATLLVGLAVGLTALSVGFAAVTALAASAPGWARARRALGAELADARERWWRHEPWPLWLLLLITWPYTLLVLGRAYAYTDHGLVAGNIGVYADWAAHLTYAGSFAYGANFPPQFPIAPGHRLAYPFLTDLLAGALVPLGTSLTSSLVLTSGLLALAFPAVMYLAGVRLLGSRGAAALAVAVFALSGGLGFVLFFGDVARLGPAALEHLPRLYTQNGAANLVWLNPVLAWMIPQRSVLLGFSLALLVMALLWTSLSRPSPAWAPFAFCGVLAGLTPLAQLHAYGTIVALAAFWAIASPRRDWAAFFVPALALGLPQAAWLAGGGAANLRWQWWWLANSGGHQDGPVWFWLKNTGLFIPALAVAFWWRPVISRRLALHLAPIWLWFLVPNLLLFQPWDWDNTKFFAYWALFGALLVGALLAHLLGRGGWARGLAVGVALALGLAGGLDLARSLDPTVSSATFTDKGGVEAAAWVRTHTSSTAVFLVAPDHNEPIPGLGGRRVVSGYPGWMWTYGLPDWFARSEDAKVMLQGGAGTAALVARYHVDYVVLGPQETGEFGASAQYWNSAGTRVYTRDGYVIYRVGAGGL
ncbi:MAG: hypothetical protein M3024_14500 [Candidatus Dormibacteraeota bacterium]|nr:hypothetical protein [Candidatus Dormibacteraeota bacterium]